MTAIAAAVCAAAAAGALVAVLAPPPARLAARLGPYLAPTAARLGIIFPAVTSGRLRNRVGDLLRTRFATSAAERRLREAGLWPGVTAEERLTRYQARVTMASAGMGLVAGALGASLGAGTTATMGMVAAGAVAGVAWRRGQVDRSIRARSQTMRLELSTICQLLAVWLKSGEGVVAACGHLVGRARGEIVGEIDQALRLHRSGISVEAAFDRIARATPERFAARLYRLLAGAERRGHDVAAGLLALADQLRGDAREELRRAATRRRAAMLLPVVGLLGPTIVLFVAAPLPWIVLRSL